MADPYPPQVAEFRAVTVGSWTPAIEGIEMLEDAVGGVLGDQSDTQTASRIRTTSYAPKTVNKQRNVEDDLSLLGQNARTGFQVALKMLDKSSIRVKAQIETTAV